MRFSLTFKCQTVCVLGFGVGVNSKSGCDVCDSCYNADSSAPLQSGGISISGSLAQASAV